MDAGFFRSLFSETKACTEAGSGTQFVVLIHRAVLCLSSQKLLLPSELQQLQQKNWYVRKIPASWIFVALQKADTSNEEICMGVFFVFEVFQSIIHN